MKAGYYCITYIGRYEISKLVSNIEYDRISPQKDMYNLNNVARGIVT